MFKHACLSLWFLLEAKSRLSYIVLFFLQIDVCGELKPSDGRVVSWLANFSPTSKVSQREASEAAVGNLCAKKRKRALRSMQ